MSALRDWLLGLLAAAMLGAVCHALAGEDRPALRLSTGLVLLLVLCSPAVDFELVEISQILTQSRTQAEQITAQAGSEETLAALISRQTEEYILDKAEAMGLTLHAEVTVVQGEQYPYPAAVTLTGHSTTTQRRRLNQWLTEELAVAEEAIRWNEEP